MKFLKQGICLALLGAGLSAAPVTLAGQATATPAPARPARRRTTAWCRRSAAPPTARSRCPPATPPAGRLRQGQPAAETCCPASRATPRRRPATRPASTSRSTAAPSAPAPASSRQDVISNGPAAGPSSYTQAYQGVPVFGALLRAHVDGDGCADRGQRLRRPRPRPVDRTPRLTRRPGRRHRGRHREGRPARRARRSRRHSSGLEAVARRARTSTATGVIKGDAGETVLAYVVEVTNRANVRDMVFIDAHTGKMVNRYSMIHNALDRELYEQHTTRRPDRCGRRATRSRAPSTRTSRTWSTSPVSPTGSSRTPSVATPTTAPAPRCGRSTTTRRIDCPNANWNGVTTNYCNGVTSDDVVSHEWGHAYTEYTHGLIYQWQSGALNESYSDIWGETLDLINGREDEGEGDITTPRTDGLCAEDGPRAVQVRHQQPGHHRQGLPGRRRRLGRDPRHHRHHQRHRAGDRRGRRGRPDRQRRLLAAHQRRRRSRATSASSTAGTCAFTVKAQNARDAGATAIVIGNNVAGGAVRARRDADPGVSRSRWSASRRPTPTGSAAVSPRARSTPRCGSPAPPTPRTRSAG